MLDLTSHKETVIRLSVQFYTKNCRFAFFETLLGNNGNKPTTGLSRAQMKYTTVN